MNAKIFGAERNFSPCKYIVGGRVSIRFFFSNSSGTMAECAERIWQRS